MNLIVSTDKYYSDEISKELVDYLNSEKLNFDNAIVYYEYPIYMDIEDQALSPKILLISPTVGVLVLNCSPVSDVDDVSILDEETSQIENYLFSKFIKSKILRGKNKRELSFVLQSALYLPLAESISYDVENVICKEKSEVAQLNSRVSAIKELIANDESAKDRLESINAKVEELKDGITEYDDTIVRQMIECIKVYGDKRIEVIFGGGTSIIEEL